MKMLHRIWADYWLKERIKEDFGICVVELEGEETIENVINWYVKPKRQRFEIVYSNAKEKSVYEFPRIWNYRKCDYETPKLKGRLVIMKMTIEIK